MRDRKSTRLNSSHTVIYTLSLHDALPIRQLLADAKPLPGADMVLSTSDDGWTAGTPLTALTDARSEEHTSELQSHSDLHSFPTRRSSDPPTARRRQTAARRRHGAVHQRRRLDGWHAADRADRC